ncbi:MAG: hypothetical protein IPM63_00010 [Acidobacteriota bacterium]|nr:MAG: hypothetical protein IPM63_00010 [Acidobacteriota bacterium]
MKTATRSQIIIAALLLTLILGPLPLTVSAQTEVTGLNVTEVTIDQNWTFAASLGTKFLIKMTGSPKEWEFKTIQGNTIGIGRLGESSRTAKKVVLGGTIEIERNSYKFAMIDVDLSQKTATLFYDNNSRIVSLGKIVGSSSTPVKAPEVIVRTSVRELSVQRTSAPNASVPASVRDIPDFILRSYTIGRWDLVRRNGVSEAQCKEMKRGETTVEINCRVSQPGAGTLELPLRIDVQKYLISVGDTGDTFWKILEARDDISKPTPRVFWVNAGSNEITFAEAQAAAIRGGYVIANEEELKWAWQEQGLNAGYPGFLDDGRLAMPLQNDKGQFKRGPNIGIAGTTTGYFAMAKHMVARTQAAPAEPKVKFYSRPGGLSLPEAQALAIQNGWVIANAEELTRAWQEDGLNQVSFGMLDDGRFAIPLQKDNEYFARGTNIGVTGGNQGFFYIEKQAAGRTQQAPPAQAASRAYYNAYEGSAEIPTFDPSDLSTFINHCNERQRNPMIDGWDQPDERQLLENAATAYFAEKGGTYELDRFRADLEADPALRWKFAPFMLRAFWDALAARKPNPAELAYRKKFNEWGRL